MSKKLLLLGSSGMLGTYISQGITKKEFEITAAARSKNNKVDFKNPDQIINFIDDMKPDVVLNAAAIISLDYCEQNPQEAELVNTITPGYISEYCNRNNIHFVHISTDHFFHNDGNTIHQEDDQVMLLNEYAKTKYAAEKLILKNQSSLVLRTSIIGRTLRKRSFLDWVINHFTSNHQIELFDDSFSSFLHCSQFISD